MVAMTRGIPYVPLADAPKERGITLANIIAVSNLAADRCGWQRHALIPTPKTFRLVGRAGLARYLIGMPVVEAISPVDAIDYDIVQLDAGANAATPIGLIAGWGWLQHVATLAQPLAADARAIPNIDGAAGENYLIGAEHVWLDATPALVRAAPVAHNTGTVVRRIHADATLASAILRMASRQQDYEERAGYSARNAVRPKPGQTVETFRVMDTEVAQTLQPFVYPHWRAPLWPAAVLPNG